MYISFKEGKKTFGLWHLLTTHDVDDVCALLSLKPPDQLCFGHSF